MDYAAGGVGCYVFGGVEVEGFAFPREGPGFGGNCSR